MIPKHPASERASFWFHLSLAGIGLAHLAAGALMLWFHGTAAKRHLQDADNE